jgi:hypothetical protein
METKIKTQFYCEIKGERICLNEESPIVILITAGNGRGYTTRYSAFLSEEGTERLHPIYKDVEVFDKIGSHKQRQRCFHYVDHDWHLRNFLADAGFTNVSPAN